MLSTRQNLAFRCPRASQLLSNDHTRDILEVFEALVENSFGCLYVASAPHEEIQYVAILLDRSPQSMLLAPAREEDARPSPMCRHNAGGDNAVHAQRFVHSSNPIAGPFQNAPRSRVAPKALPHPAQLSEKRKDNPTA